MAFHHVAIASRDIKASHEFYTGAMGFTLVKAEASRSGEDGWAKHLFYDTGGQGLMALWDLHDDSLPPDWRSAISDGLGLPRWVNHIAFEARDRDDLEARKRRLLEHGVDVTEIDHRWCVSIYANDPNDILVEFCWTSVEFTAADAEEALRVLNDASPEIVPASKIVVHRASQPGSRRVS